MWQKFKKRRRPEAEVRLRGNVYSYLCNTGPTFNTVYPWYTIFQKAVRSVNQIQNDFKVNCLSSWLNFDIQYDTVWQVLQNDISKRVTPIFSVVFARAIGKNRKGAPNPNFGEIRTISKMDGSSASDALSRLTNQPNTYQTTLSIQ